MSKPFVSRSLAFVGLILATTLGATDTFATTRPNWVEQPPHEDSKYKYYVGRSAEAPNEQSGVSQAINDASDGAIKENFGVTMMVTSETVETLVGVSAHRRLNESSRRVQLHDFEQMDLYREASPDGRISAWVLFRYDRSAINREKLRLATQKDAPETTESVAEVGNGVKTLGSLEVITEPAGASLFVDGERWGVSPLRINGRLTVGEHSIVIDHEQYQTIEETFIAVPGRMLKI